jgi:ABC-type Na+ efflux pump permease subunit
LEPLLVLPLSHGRLAFGLTLGASPVAMAQLGAGVLLLVANAAVPFSTFAQPLGVVVAMATGGLVAVAVLGLLASATGCLAGALGTGTDEAVGLGDLLAVPFVAVGVTLFLAPDLPATVVTCAVPILGQALLVREAVGGTLSPTCAAAALLSAAATVALLMAAAGRALGRERRLAGAAT